MLESASAFMKQQMGKLEKEKELFFKLLRILQTIEVIKSSQK